MNDDHLAIDVNLGLRGEGYAVSVILEGEDSPETIGLKGASMRWKQALKTIGVGGRKARMKLVLQTGEQYTCCAFRMCGAL